MERPAWDQLATSLSLDRLIGVLNTRLPRWADQLGRVQRKKVLSVSANAVLTSSVDVVLVDTTTAGVTLSTLAPASQFRGHAFWVKRIAGGNNITFDPAGSETVDGAASAVVNSTIVICDGSNWFTWAG